MNCFLILLRSYNYICSFRYQILFNYPELRSSSEKLQTFIAYDDVFSGSNISATSAKNVFKN